MLLRVTADHSDTDPLFSVVPGINQTFRVGVWEAGNMGKWTDSTLAWVKKWWLRQLASDCLQSRSCCGLFQGSEYAEGSGCPGLTPPSRPVHWGKVHKNWTTERWKTMAPVLMWVDLKGLLLTCWCEIPQLTYVAERRASLTQHSRRLFAMLSDRWWSSINCRLLHRDCNSAPHSGCIFFSVTWGWLNEKVSYLLIVWRQTGSSCFLLFFSQNLDTRGRCLSTLSVQ